MLNLKFSKTSDVYFSFRNDFGLKSKNNLKMAIEGINRSDFPILNVEAYPNKPLIYLDSAGMLQYNLFHISYRFFKHQIKISSIVSKT